MLQRPSDVAILIYFRCSQDECLEGSVCKGEYTELGLRDKGGPDYAEPLRHCKDFSFHSGRWGVIGGI